MGSGFDSRRVHVAFSLPSHVLPNELTYAGSGLKTRPVARAPTSVTRTKLRESVTVRSSYRYCAHAKRRSVYHVSWWDPFYGETTVRLAVCLWRYLDGIRVRFPACTCYVLSTVNQFYSTN